MTNDIHRDLLVGPQSTSATSFSARVDNLLAGWQTVDKLFILGILYGSTLSMVKVFGILIM